MSELITSANIDLVIKQNDEIKNDIESRAMRLQSNRSIMRVASVPQLALVILRTFGLVQLPIYDKFWSGAIFVKEGKTIPVINTALPRANQYFTAWHEVYHLIFDKISFDYFIENESTIEERKAECFAAQMLLAGVDRYFNDLSEMDFLSKVFCCMSAFQAPYKAVLVALYEYAVHSDNENLKERIKEVFDLRFENLPEQFQSLGLDDSLVLPSNVINMAPLQEKIRFNEKNNPELSYHKDNENYLENIMKEISMIARENKWPR